MRCFAAGSALGAAAILVLVGTLVASASAAPETRFRVTFVGDSVSESINYATPAERVLRSGFDMRFDLAACRRLVAPGCLYKGAVPSTGLEAVQSYRTRLGDVLIVNVGYNEGPYGYAQGIDRVMRAALRQGAQGVVWVTLRETRKVYASTNRAIRSAAKRWRRLVLADWNAYSAGKPWFGSDGVHLTGSGAEAMARFLRPYVVRAAARS